LPDIGKKIAYKATAAVVAERSLIRRAEEYRVDLA